MYNRKLHCAILRVARNAHLLAVTGQMPLQTELLIDRDDSHHRTSDARDPTLVAFR